nr:hypothetical protein [Collimonas arenae]
MTASVLVAVSWPDATLVICRSAPGAPTLTTLVGLVPANAYEVPPIVTLEVGVDAAVVDPAPSATSPALLATAPEPNARPLVATALAVSPKATDPAPPAVEVLPRATEPWPDAELVLPMATAP